MTQNNNVIEKRKFKSDQTFSSTNEKTRKVWYAICCGVGIIMAIISLICGNSITIRAIISLLAILFSGEYFVKYQSFKSKNYLFGACVWAFIAVFQLVDYILLSLKAM